MKSLVRDDHQGVPTDFRRRSARCARFEALDRPDVADLSAEAINNMTCPTDFRRRSARCARFEALDRPDVADLSAEAINNMTCDELVRMIYVARLPALLRTDLDQHLPFYDRTVLTQLGVRSQKVVVGVSLLG